MWSRRQSARARGCSHHAVQNTLRESPYSISKLATTTHTTCRHGALQVPQFSSTMRIVESTSTVALPRLIKHSMAQHSTLVLDIATWGTDGSCQPMDCGRSGLGNM